MISKYTNELRPIDWVHVTVSVVTMLILGTILVATQFKEEVRPKDVKEEVVTRFEALVPKIEGLLTAVHTTQDQITSSTAWHKELTELVGSLQNQMQFLVKQFDDRGVEIRRIDDLVKLIDERTADRFTGEQGRALEGRVQALEKCIEGMKR